MLASPVRGLILAELNQGLPGVSPEIGQVVAQACAFCLKTNSHDNNVELDVDGVESTKFRIIWDTNVSDQVLRSWGDEVQEQGACAIAFLLVPKIIQHTVVLRARKKTGVDYWLGDLSSENPLEITARLEVSGILKGNISSINTRVARKLRQTEQSKGSLPAYVVVVEFSKPQARLVKYE